jgi:hypothetical protein
MRVFFFFVFYSIDVEGEGQLSQFPQALRPLITSYIVDAQFCLSFLKTLDLRTRTLQADVL